MNIDYDISLIFRHSIAVRSTNLVKLCRQDLIVYATTSHIAYMAGGSCWHYVPGIFINNENASPKTNIFHGALICIRMNVRSSKQLRLNLETSNHAMTFEIRRGNNLC